MNSAPHSEGAVAELVYYPVKSLPGINLERAVLGPRGIARDRMWMLVRESGRLITQRKEHRLALLRVEAQDDRFWISSPSGEGVYLPAHPASQQTIEASVWKDDVEAVVGQSDARDFFSSYLGYPCIPVYMPEHATRKAGGHAPAGTPVSFADAYPGLLTSTASLAELNERAGYPLVMKRFRPNVVASNTHAFAEDTWLRVQMGDAEIACVKPCDRCVLTTIDPETGTAGKEPLRTLARFRRIGKEIYFGQNFVVLRGGTVRVGDEISVLERKEPLFSDLTKG